MADALGNTVITGYVGGNTNSVYFDGIQIDPFGQSANAFMARYDPNGAIVYAERMGGGANDTGAGLALANDSTFYLTGTTWGSTPWLNWNFQSCCADPNLFIAKLHDVFGDLATGTSNLSSSVRGIAISPNPVSDQLSLSGLGTSDQVGILDAQGRMLVNGSRGRVFDVSGWVEGVYVLSITDAKGVNSVIRFAVQR